MTIYLGVDVGTTHVKVMAVSEVGGFVEVEAVTPWQTLEGRRVLDPDTLWEVVQQLLAESLDACHGPGDTVRAVAVTSMAEAGLFVSDSSPLGYIGAWQDIVSTKTTYLRFLEDWDPGEVYARTGIAVGQKFGLFRMRQEAHPAAACWLSVADFVVWRLTGGERVTHSSLAVRTMAYNPTRAAWDEGLLAWAHLRPSNVPTVVQGVAESAPVRHGDPRLDGARAVNAGHDHVVAAYGADLTVEELMDSTGTAEPLMVRTAVPNLSEAARSQGVLWAPGLFDDGSFLALLPTPGGGASETWARHLLHLEWPEVSELEPERSTPVRFDPQGWATGEAHWSGLGGDVSALDLYWSALVGVAEGVGHGVHVMEQLMHQAYPSIKVVGGIARHDLWIAIRGKVLRREQWLLQPSSGALVGAVRAAAAAVGEDSPLRLHWERRPPG